MRRSRVHVAALAVVLLVVGQLASLAHQAGTRHVTCGEHGEELEAATLVEQLHACEQDHLIGVEGDAGGDHEDCAIARALHQSAQTSRFVLLAHLEPIASTTSAVTPIALTPVTALYRIAPKTSPPARLRTLFA
jgi:hypothetical protein